MLKILNFCYTCIYIYIYILESGTLTIAPHWLVVSNVLESQMQDVIHVFLTLFNFYLCRITQQFTTSPLPVSEDISSTDATVSQ